MLGFMHFYILLVVDPFDLGVQKRDRLHRMMWYESFAHLVT